VTAAPVPRHSAMTPSSRTIFRPRCTADDAVNWLFVRQSTWNKGWHSLPGVSGWLHVRPELDLWVALTPRAVRLVYSTGKGLYRLASTEPCFVTARLGVSRVRGRLER
jgi:hypothetical protein